MRTKTTFYKGFQVTYLKNDFPCFEVRVSPRILIAITRDCPEKQAQSLAFRAIDYWLEYQFFRIDKEAAQHQLSVLLEYPVQLVSYSVKNA